MKHLRIMPLALLSSRPAWRVFLMVVVAAVTIFYANVAIAQLEGVRDADEWYYCYSSQYSNSQSSATGLPWSDVECQQLLWQDNGGGSYQSLVINGAVSVNGANDDPEYAGIRGWVIPARGIEKFEYACDAIASECNVALSGSAGAYSHSGTGAGHSDDGADYSISSPNATGVGNCGTEQIDTVGTFRANTYDRWWDVDPFATWTTGGTIEGSWFDAEAAVTSDNRTATAAFACTVTEWWEWADWLEDNDPWIPYFPTPTPESPAMVLTPMLTPVWMVPTPQPGGFEIIPGDTTCYTLLPGWTFGPYTVAGNVLELGWDANIVCATEHTFTFALFDWGVQYFLLAILGVGALGIFYSRMR